jgi:hypothetical protein
MMHHHHPGRLYFQKLITLSYLMNCPHNQIPIHVPRVSDGCTAQILKLQCHMLGDPLLTPTTSPCTPTILTWIEQALLLPATPPALPHL